MEKILVVFAAPTPIEKSHTACLINRFLQYYNDLHVGAEVTWLDLNQEKDVNSQVLTYNNKLEFFGCSDKYINQLKSVDKLIIGTPMNNFNITGLLKTYLDLIMVANKTFQYKYDGYHKSVGLLTHLKVQIICNQGAPVEWYPYSSFTTYLEGCFAFMGCNVNHSILMDGTKLAKYKGKSNDEIVNEYEGQIRDAVKLF